MMGVQNPFQSRTLNSRCMTQSPDDAKPTPADQFRPLQSVFRRRLLTGVGAASLLAVGANFGGVTSFLLGFSPRRLRGLLSSTPSIPSPATADILIPTKDSRAAGKAERALDPPPLSGSGGERRRNVNEPAVAFGPPGSTGELSVSVIVSQVPIDFSIEAFGGADDVGEAVIRTITRSGKRTDVKGTLIGSSLREDLVRKGEVL